MVEGVAAFTGVLQSNSVKALAVTTPNRLANFPDLPAAAETLPGYQSRGWTAVIAPAGTTDDVVRKVNADLRTVLDIPEVKSRLESSATYVRHMSPAETRDYIRAEQQAWRPVVKQFGVTTPVRPAEGLLPLAYASKQLFLLLYFRNKPRRSPDWSPNLCWLARIPLLRRGVVDVPHFPCRAGGKRRRPDRPRHRSPQLGARTTGAVTVAGSWLQPRGREL